MSRRVALLIERITMNSRIAALFPGPVALLVWGLTNTAKQSIIIIKRCNAYSYCLQSVTQLSHLNNVNTHSRIKNISKVCNALPVLYYVQTFAKRRCNTAIYFYIIMHVKRYMADTLVRASDKCSQCYHFQTRVMRTWSIRYMWPTQLQISLHILEVWSGATLSDVKFSQFHWLG